VGKRAFALLAGLLIVACASVTNPVTGDREWTTMTPEQERQQCAAFALWIERVGAPQQLDDRRRFAVLDHHLRQVAEQRRGSRRQLARGCRQATFQQRHLSPGNAAQRRGADRRILGVRQQHLAHGHQSVLAAGFAQGADELQPHLAAWVLH
jgi:hypothetical protein